MGHGPPSNVQWALGPGRWRGDHNPIKIPARAPIPSSHLPTGDVVDRPMRHRVPSSSPAWLPDFTPPTPLEHGAWRLSPLRPELAVIDHAAWRSCRERLVRELDWGGWPAEGFGLSDNIADLAEHHAEFVRREAFAYSVLEGDRCIGCVYIEPWSEGAQLAFWVIDEVLDAEADIVTAVLDWLRNWPFEQVIVPVREANTRARRWLEARGYMPCAGPPGHVSFGERGPQRSSCDHPEEPNP